MIYLTYCFINFPIVIVIIDSIEGIQFPECSTLACGLLWVEGIWEHVGSRETFAPLLTTRIKMTWDRLTGKNHI